MGLGKKEIIVTLLFANIILTIAAITENQYIAYLILGIGLIISICYSMVIVGAKK
ncbi:MAG: hypothetical protein WDZ91_04365 [Paenibacillaceae bacterium]